MTWEDDNIWLITFFYVPVGVSLLIGTTLFAASLIRLLIVAVKARKLKNIILPYMRVLLFIFEFLLIFGLFVAYHIHYSVNASDIYYSYGEYYACLSGVNAAANSLFADPSDCSPVSVSPSLVMMQSFAISCFGLLLFFTFTSWDTVRHWGALFATVAAVIWRRNKLDLLKLWNLVGTSEVTLSPATADCSAVSIGYEMEQTNTES